MARGCSRHMRTRDPLCVERFSGFSLSSPFEGWSFCYWLAVCVVWYTTHRVKASLNIDFYTHANAHAFAQYVVALVSCRWQVESNLCGQRTAEGNGTLRAAARRRERRLRSFGRLRQCTAASQRLQQPNTPATCRHWTSACLRLKLDWKSLKGNRSFKVQGAPKAPIRTGASLRRLCARTSLITSMRSKRNCTC